MLARQLIATVEEQSYDTDTARLTSSLFSRWSTMPVTVLLFKKTIFVKAPIDIGPCWNTSLRQMSCGVEILYFSKISLECFDIA